MHDAEAVTGGCLCGKIRYAAMAHVRDAYYCHCRICQKTIGAPAEIGVLLVPGTLRFEGAEPTYYQSSPFGKRGFCDVCGSRIIWASVNGEKPEWDNVSAGSLDDSEQVAPTSHQCVESRLSWYRFDDGLPNYRSDEMPELVAAWQKAGQA